MLKIKLRMFVRLFADAPKEIPMIVREFNMERSYNGDTPVYEPTAYVIAIFLYLWYFIKFDVLGRCEDYSDANRYF